MIKNYFLNIYTLLFSKLAKKISIVLSGNLIASGLGFINSIFILRVLGTEDIGLLYPAIGFMLIFTSFADLGISPTFIKLGSSKEYEGEGDFRRIFNTTLRMKVVLGFVASIICMIFSKQFSIYAYGNAENQKYILMIIVGIFFQNISSFYTSYLQIQLNEKLLFLSKVIPVVIKFLLIIAFYFTNYLTIDSLLWAFMAAPVLHFLFPFLFGVPFHLYDRNSFDKKIMKKIFVFARWIALSGAINGIIGQTDILMTKSMLGSEDLGILVGGQKLSSPFILITSALVSMLLPKISSLSTFKELNFIFRKSLYAIPIILVALLVFVPLAPYIIDLFLGAKYQLSSKVFQIYLCSFLIGLYITPVSTILYKLNMEFTFFILNIIQLFLNIGLNSFLIPKYGPSGAAMATLCTGMFAVFFTLALIIKSGIPKKDNFDRKI